MFQPLLATKFYIPPARANAVSRPRLTERMLAGLHQPGSFTLLSGPPGFGKTTLLSEYTARLGRPVAWVSLDEGDNDPIRFWNYLIAACQSIEKEIGESALALLRTPQPLPVEAIPAILINDLAGMDCDLVLVLDDYHAIQNETIHAALLFLLEHLPENLHLVISTRADPPWPLARFRARNQLVEVRTQDLRFTTEEAAAFLNRLMGLNLATEDVSALEERTEGWAAGLQLAALSMIGRSDIAGFVRAFTGSHVYIAEYLVEEVLQRQPEDVQAFLLQTSILERLNAGLCNAVTGCQDGQGVLVALNRANLFVLPLDDVGQWYRYHHLFSDLLQARLRQTSPADAITTLHQRAAAWYEQAGMTQQAIEHALAAAEYSADYSLALELIEKVALSMVLQAYFNTVEDWLRAIPPEHLSEKPRANMAFARMYLMRRSLAKAAPYLEQLQRIFSTTKQEKIDPALQGEWLALQSMLLNAQGKAVESRDLAEQALIILAEEETQVRGLIYIELAAAYQQTYDYGRAAEACELIIQQGRLAGDFASEMFGLSYLGRMYLYQGMLRSTDEIASEALQRLKQTGSFSPFSATLYGELAQVYYYWHELEKAREYFLRSVELSTLGGFSDAEIYHSVFLSRLFQMEGDLQASMREMEKALDRMRTAAPALVNEEVISQQVSIDLALDRLAAAQTALKPYGFAFEDSFSAPGLAMDADVPLADVRIPYPVGLLYDSALRILLYRAAVRHELKELMYGIELAGLVIEGSLRCRHLPIVLKTLLLRGQMQAALGDERAGLADVAKALELGEPEGFMSTFIEEGLPIKEALTTLLKRNMAGSASAGYIRDILAAFPKTLSKQEAVTPHKPARSDEFSTDKSSALFEPLTARELEVLRLIAAGDSNRAIAEKLVITVSAVKKHTANIYGKLNVDSRTQAVALARQLGLLPQDG